MLGTSFDAAASRHKYSIYPYATSVLLFNGAIALLPEYTLHGDDTHTRDTYVDHFFFFLQTFRTQRTGIRRCWDVDEMGRGGGGGQHVTYFHTKWDKHTHMDEHNIRI